MPTRVRTVTTTEGTHGLFRLYRRASEFFNAHAALARCARASDFPTRLKLLGEAAVNLRIDVTQDVFPLYGDTLIRLVRQESPPCTADMVHGLACTLHPDGERFAATARTAADALSAGDLRAFRVEVQELSRLFIYLDALG